MAFSSPSVETVNPVPAQPFSAAEKSKFRIRFRKSGDLRLVSHHDLMHCFERMLRRADLPIRSTQGFHPHPCMTFALSLALGIIGGAEVVELEFTSALSAEEVRARLARQAPPGLDILNVQAVNAQSKPQVRRAFYRALVPAELCTILPQRIAAFRGAESCWIDRQRPQPRRLDIRPYVSELSLDGTAVEMALWVTPYGAARPEEILQQLGLGDRFEAGDLVLERTNLELHDEVPAGAEPPPAALLQAPRMDQTKQSNDTGRSVAAAVEKEPVLAAESAPRPTPLISSPMAYDS